MRETAAIQARGLAKRYVIARQDDGLRYQALRDVVTDWARGVLQGRKKSQRRKSEEFWALRDVSFDIKRGEIVGIIGRNGAGKSTLLKILSRITEPSQGIVTIQGRVASLLEVGTGFHPELTGRENIFLNGAILGMTRAEIRQRFDEIVSFAEVERFLDTPVKRYSSGMYVRLAFSVAAHLDPEVLIVDEVLAVGDAQFQRKCLGRIGQVASGGRTVLFVSHNMNAVERLCSRAIWMDRGSIAAESNDVAGVISSYLASGGEENGLVSVWKNENNSYDHPLFKPLEFAVTDEDGEPLCGPIRNDQSINVVMRLHIRRSDPALIFGVALYSGSSETLLWSLTTDGPEAEWITLDVGCVELRCRLPRRFLNEGVYRLELHGESFQREWILRPGNSPSVHFEIRGGLSESPYWLGVRPGVLAPVWKWEREK